MTPFESDYDRDAREELGRSLQAYVERLEQQVATLTARVADVEEQNNAGRASWQHLLDMKKTQDERIVTLIEALKAAEWSGRTWTDYPSCPWCGALEEGLPAYSKGQTQFPAEPPKTHRAECQFMRALAAVRGERCVHDFDAGGISENIIVSPHCRKCGAVRRGAMRPTRFWKWCYWGFEYQVHGVNKKPVCRVCSWGFGRGKWWFGLQRWTEEPSQMKLIGER